MQSPQRRSNLDRSLQANYGGGYRVGTTTISSIDVSHDRKDSGKMRSRLMRALNISDNQFETPLMKKLNDKKKVILDQIIHIEKRINV